VYRTQPGLAFRKELSAQAAAEEPELRWQKTPNGTRRVSHNNFIRGTRRVPAEFKNIKIAKGGVCRASGATGCIGEALNITHLKGQ